MERVNLGYSVKNIPTANERLYKTQLVDSIEAVIKRMRWKAIFFTNGDPDLQENGDPGLQETPEYKNYSLKTNRCPAQVNSMKKFEADLINITNNISFRKTTNPLQKKMKEDLRRPKKYARIQ